MKILKGQVFAGKLIIENSFIDFGLFTCGKNKQANKLNRAAIIPLEEYAKLLQIAEQFERLAILMPLHEALQKREIEIMDEAQVDKKLLEDVSGKKGKTYFKK